MKKNIFKRLMALGLSLVTSFTMMSETLASAENWSEKLTNKQYSLSNWGYNFSGSGLPKAYNPFKAKKDDGSTIDKGMTNNSFNYKWANDFYYWTDKNGRSAYCLQLGVSHVNGTEMAKFDGSDDGEIENFYGSAVGQLLRTASIYTYKLPTSNASPTSGSKTNSKYGYSWEVELVASQCIVWAISSKTYFDSSTTALSSYETTLLNCIKTPNTSKKADLINCYKQMKEDIIKHLTIPKGTAKTDKLISSSNTYTLTYNTSEKKWECEISSDSMMQHFDIASSISGVTVTHSGNNLTFSCTDAGAKTLASKTSVKLVKTSAINASKMDECSPLIYATAKDNTSSQAKIAYYSNNDPVEAYVAFKMSTGDLKIKKKINDNGEIKSANEYSYEYFDEKLNTNVKYTWDKSYKWDNSVSDWVEFKSAPTSNPTFSAGLRNIIRFRIKNSEGKYVVCNRYTLCVEQHAF